GSDYFAARRVGERAAAWVRAGNGPALVHAKVTRPLSHPSQDSQAKYRPPEELAEEALNDPLRLLADALVGAGVVSIDEIEDIRRRASDDVAAAAQRALAAARPDPITVVDHVLAFKPLTAPPPEPDAEPPPLVHAL